MVPIPSLPGFSDPWIRANPHLRLVLLVIPFLLIALYYEAEWAAWTAAGIWLAVMVLHLFIRKKPPPHYFERDEFGRKRFYH